MLGIRRTLAAAVALVAATTTAQAQSCWQFVNSKYLPQFENPPGILCQAWFGSGVSKVSATGTGSHGCGHGVALDAGAGCEAESQTAVATGFFMERWENACDPGEVEFKAEADIQGEADLVDDDCAAAALGYNRVTSTVLDAPVFAHVTKSQGETKKGSLGNVGVGGGGLYANVSVTPSLGTGTYSDSDSDYRDNVVCADVLQYELKTRAFIRVWANANLLKALCTAEMLGTTKVEFVLGDCPD